MAEAAVKYNSKAVRLTEQLRSDIMSGVFEAEHPLPTEEELSVRYAVARGTVHRCLISLSESGVLQLDRRRNWRVAGALRPEAECGRTPDGAERRIGALLGGSRDQMYFRSMAGIQSYCDQNRLYCECLQYADYAGALALLRNPEEYDLDGLVVIPYLAADYAEVLRELEARGFPLVCIDQTDGLELPLVESDHAGGIYQATRLLLERYLRPVYFFSSAVFEAERPGYDGYCRAMADAGFVATCPEFTVRPDYANTAVSLDDLNCAPQCNYALQWLPTLKFPVSIMAANDYGAWGIHQAAEQLGLRIGEEIKLWGLGDLPVCRYLTPRLSSIAQPHEAVGFEAARLLGRIMRRRPANPVHKILPVKLIERQSS